jgi:hypothetical protein
MNQSFAPHPLTYPHFSKQVNRTLFEYARPDPFLDILLAATLNDERVNAFEMQKV